MSFDVVVIGGGHAGIAAALRLKARGVKHVAILEREAVLGGALLRSPRRVYGFWQFGRLLTGPAYAARLAQAAAAAGVEILLNHDVTALRPNGVMAVSAPDSTRVMARRVLLTAPVAVSHLHLDPALGGPAVDQYGRCADVSYFATARLAGMEAPAFRSGTIAGDYIADDLSGGLPSLEGRLVVLAGPGVRYVVPQVLAHVAPLRGRLDVGAAEARQGQLRVRAGEAVLYRRRVAVQPGRHIVINLDGMKTPPDDAQLIVEIVA
ncbi:MAG: FAD-dependent oxidoreductase [Rhodospirillales bacterium]|nr:FAD-dependent oxidoreductase [Rhodospirillales bacterium]